MLIVLYRKTNGDFKCTNVCLRLFYLLRMPDYIKNGIHHIIVSYFSEYFVFFVAGKWIVLFPNYEMRIYEETGACTEINANKCK